MQQAACQWHAPPFYVHEHEPRRMLQSKTRSLRIVTTVSGYCAVKAPCRSTLPHSTRRHRRRRLNSQRCTSQATQQPESYKWAEELIQQYVKPHSVVGLGTGVLVNTVIECMAQMANAGRLQGVKCIPASDVSASEAAFQGVTITSLADHPQVDVVFEEVDEIALQDAGLPFVAGRLAEPIQPQLLRMRSLLAASKCNVVLVDGLERTSGRLRGVLPVVVDADVWEDAGEALDDTFIPDAEVWRRTTTGYDPSDPRAQANPYLSAEGHNILDVKFYGPFKLYGEDAEYGAIAAEVEQQTGVITHGLFVGVATAAALITADGVDMFEPATSMQ